MSETEPTPSEPMMETPELPPSIHPSLLEMPPTPFVPTPMPTSTVTEMPGPGEAIIGPDTQMQMDPPSEEHPEPKFPSHLQFERGLAAELEEWIKAWVTWKKT